MDSMCRIECLAIRSLDFLIDRCMALEILEPPVEFRYIALPRMGRCPQPRLIGQRVKQQNSGPPSWVELQNAIRCFWRLQLYFDLQIAASSSHLNWSAYDQEQLGRLGIASFWKVCEDDQDFLEGELATVVAYLAEQFPHNSVQLGHLSRDYGKLNKATEGFRIALMDTLRSDSPLRYTDRSRFRNCGFFLFDAERMATLGFMHWTSTSEHPLRQDLVMSMSNRRYRWESILSDEELKAIEHQRLAEFPEHLRTIISYTGTTFRAAKSEFYIHSHYHWRKASSHLSGGYAYRSARYSFADDSNDQCSFNNSYSYHCDSDHSESTPTPSTGVAVAVYTSLGSVYSKDSQLRLCGLLNESAIYTSTATSKWGVTGIPRLGPFSFGNGKNCYYQGVQQGLTCDSKAVAGDSWTWVNCYKNGVPDQGNCVGQDVTCDTAGKIEYNALPMAGGRGGLY
ncbi:hypothetical protein BKA61DRAFT_576928 [Leptodontidium sp. MPI-SDFR-AT-0119]|nr:hypothetical protein BKA61DRAFT_576928 [Leptodontidium sp. MPI-SDFR-AT-0119]